MAKKKKAPKAESKKIKRKVPAKKGKKQALSVSAVARGGGLHDPS